jgi:preprotein translocase subunit SecB
MMLRARRKEPQFLQESTDMADEGNIISDLNLGQPAPNGEDTAPAIGLISQYVKDLSVENPNAPESYQWTDAGYPDRIQHRRAQHRAGRP